MKRLFLLVLCAVSTASAQQYRPLSEFGEDTVTYLKTNFFYRDGTPIHENIGEIFEILEPELKSIRYDASSPDFYPWRMFLSFSERKNDHIRPDYPDLCLIVSFKAKPDSIPFELLDISADEWVPLRPDHLQWLSSWDARSLSVYYYPVKPAPFSRKIPNEFYDPHTQILDTLAYAQAVCSFDRKVNKTLRLLNRYIKTVEYRSTHGATEVKGILIGFKTKEQLARELSTMSISEGVLLFVEFQQPIPAGPILRRMGPVLNRTGSKPYKRYYPKLFRNAKVKDAMGIDIARFS